MIAKFQQIFSSYKATTIAWLALICSTGIGWLFGHSIQVGAQFAATGVIITAFVKVWIIGFQFMELKNAPKWLRWIFYAWILIITVTLVVISI